MSDYFQKTFLRLFLIIVSALLVFGCRPEVPASTPALPSAAVSLDAPTLAATSTSSAPAATEALPPAPAGAATSTPAEVGSGRLEEGEITSPALKGNLLGDPATRPYAIYLPPGYDTHPEARYPVIYVLHGYSQHIDDMTDTTAAIDRLTASGKTGEMIAVYVDGWNAFGGSWYHTSAATGDYEAYITRDLVSYIDATYRTLADREHRGLAGFSMGGFGAMHLAFKYPQVFGAVVSEAGPYDMETILENLPTFAAQQTAAAEPEDVTAIAGMDPEARLILSLAGAMAPNPGKPPMYLDKPYEMVDGKLKVNQDVIDRIRQEDVFRGLESYAKGETRLLGILIVHGENDHPEDARRLSETMTGMGIENEYFEHPGGHVFVPEPAFEFLWDKIGG